MGEILNQLPANIQIHIKNITASSDLPDTDESYEKIAEGWLEKKALFEKEMSERGMVEVESFDKEAELGGVALTYSGSLVLVGPKVDNKRQSVYNSIGLRKNVPDSVVQEGSVLSEDVATDQPISFEHGPVKKTSPIYKFAVCEEGSIEEQTEVINEATQILTDEFVDVNKALVPA